MIYIVGDDELMKRKDRKLMGECKNASEKIKAIMPQLKNRKTGKHTIEVIVAAGLILGTFGEYGVPGPRERK